MAINKDKFKIAYFSMEMELENAIKTYSGGLGILAGDLLRSAADLRLPIVGITLLNDQGYFDQKINAVGEQEETIVVDYDFSHLKKIRNTAIIKIGQDNVKVGAWRYLINGTDGFKIPVYLLDTNFPENKPIYQSLTGKLYGNNKEYRLLQEIVLGRGGFAMLKSIGYGIKKFHINEGHGSFVAISQFLASRRKSLVARVTDTKKRCIFTTHTPVKMANDIFPLDLVLKYQPDFPLNIPEIIKDKQVNMTKVALYFSGYINGVAISHALFSHKMFPDYPIHAITNGVHSLTWTSPEFAELYDKHLFNWRHSSLSLRNAFIIPDAEIWEAHQGAKTRLLKFVEEKTGVKFEQAIFTIGFARRFTAYKRPLLLLSDIEKLISISNNVGKIQIVYAGKAHPGDVGGKKLVAELSAIIKKYQPQIKIIFLEGYDTDISKLMTAGVDLWVNTPLPPNEASGTSGMKAAHNGVPQLSTFDGWWREGYIRGKTGWTIWGNKITSAGDVDYKDALSLYNLLEKEIIPLYYNNPQKWQEMMRFVIGINASFFNTERVLREYAQNAYL
ncbi:MAG TPA: alpha-glucan family phosphorylase [Candidatus Saccharimonadales bacterium]|nr:alpha-glucan family phosphorylase [Candidatus Saccharimonadales bacterium]